MGDPRKAKKKYSTPRHPWQGLRIEEEKELIKEFGLKNKKEIWKATSLLRNFKNQTKGKGNKPEEQIQKEKELLLNKLSKLNILQEKSKLDDVLSLSVKDILERRLQTLVFRQNLARSVKQARQFIIHGHIQINGIKTNVPSLLVDKNQETTITFIQNSKLNDKEHPERLIKIPKDKLTKEAKSSEKLKASQKLSDAEKEDKKAKEEKKTTKKKVEKKETKK